AGPAEYGAHANWFPGARACLAGDERAIRQRPAGGYGRSRPEFPAGTVWAGDSEPGEPKPRARAAESFRGGSGGSGDLPERTAERRAADSGIQPGRSRERDQLRKLVFRDGSGAATECVGEIKADILADARVAGARASTPLRRGYAHASPPAWGNCAHFAR